MARLVGDWNWAWKLLTQGNRRLTLEQIHPDVLECLDHQVRIFDYYRSEYSERQGRGHYEREMKKHLPDYPYLIFCEKHKLAPLKERSIDIFREGSQEYVDWCLEQGKSPADFRARMEFFEGYKDHPKKVRKIVI